MSKGPIGTPAEERKEAKASQKQADKEYKEADRAVKKAGKEVSEAVVTQQHADNENAEADAAKASSDARGWRNANESRSNLLLPPVKMGAAERVKAKAAASAEAFKQRQAQKLAELRAATAEQTNANAEYKRTAEESEQAKLDKEGKTKYKDSKGMTHTKRIPDKVIAPGFLQSSDVVQQLSNGVTGGEPWEDNWYAIRPGDDTKYSPVNENKAGYEEWENRQSAAANERKNARMLEEDAKQKKQIEEDKKKRDENMIHIPSHIIDSTKGWRDQDTWERMLRGDDIAPDMVVSKWATADLSDPVADAKADLQSRKADFKDEVEKTKAFMKQDKEGREAKAAPNIISMSDIHDLIKSLYPTPNDDYYTTYDKLSDIRSIEDTTERNKALIDFYKELEGEKRRRSNPSRAEIKENFRNPDIARKSPNTKTTGEMDTLEGAISKKQLTKLSEYDKRKAVGEDIAMKSKYTSAQKMQGMAQRKLNELLAEGKDDNDPQVKAARAIIRQANATLRYAGKGNDTGTAVSKVELSDDDKKRFSEDFQDFNSLLPDSPITDRDTMRYQSQYNDFLKWLSKGKQHSSYGDLSKFGALGIPVEDLAKKMPIHNFGDIIAMRNLLWPRLSDDELATKIQEVKDRYPDLTDVQARELANRDYFAGLPTFMNKSLKGLYNELGGEGDPIDPDTSTYLSSYSPEEALNMAKQEDLDKYKSKLSKFRDQPGALENALKRNRELSSMFGNSAKSLMDAANTEPTIDVVRRYLGDISDLKDEATRQKFLGNAPEAKYSAAQKDSQAWNDLVTYFEKDTPEHIDAIKNSAEELITGADWPEDVVVMLDKLTANPEGASLDAQGKPVNLKVKLENALKDVETYTKVVDNPNTDDETYDVALRNLEYAQKQVSDTKKQLRAFSKQKSPMLEVLDFAKQLAQERGDDYLRFEINPHKNVPLELNEKNITNAIVHATEEALNYLQEVSGLRKTKGELNAEGAAGEDNVPQDTLDRLISAIGGPKISDYDRAKMTGKRFK